MPNDSALTLLVNPRDLEAEIGVEFLARCFGESWSRAAYRWYLQRVFHREAPDRLVLVAGKRVLAAVGIAYRQVRTPDGGIHRVAIGVAGCTAPAERGRGRFSRLWRAAIEHCAARGCTAILGFVTTDNATYRELRRVGAAAIPSSYIASADPPKESATTVLEVSEIAQTEWRDYADAALQLQSSTAVAGFHYPDADVWRSQFVDRPYPVELLRMGDTSRAIIERVDDTDRLQWFDGDPQEQGAAIAAMVLRARRAHRRFFMYSTAAVPAATLQGCGLSARPGSMMAQATRPGYEPIVRSWSTLPWAVYSGDRM